MAEKSAAQIKTDAATNLADNTSGAITPEIVRNTVIDIADSFVEVVTGKGLSTEDYTTAEQTKLAGIEEGATANRSDALTDTAIANAVAAVSIAPRTGLTFTGELDLSEYTEAVYLDYTTGAAVAVTIGANPVATSTATVRIQGNLTTSIPAEWSFSGTALSTLSNELNELSVKYYSADDIRAVNRVINTGAALTYFIDIITPVEAESFEEGSTITFTSEITTVG